jgi:hypothetical protein
MEREKERERGAVPVQVWPKNLDKLEDIQCGAEAVNVELKIFAARFNVTKEGNLTASVV